MPEGFIKQYAWQKKHKLFWSYVNSKRKGSNDLTVVKLDNGSILTDKCDISERMNKLLHPFLHGKTWKIFCHLNRSLSF